MSRPKSNPASSTEISPRELLDGIRAGGVGVWQWMADTGKVTWSPNMPAIHRVPANEFDGTFDYFVRDIHPEDRAQVLAAIGRAIDSAGGLHAEYRLPQRDGEDERWIETKGAAIVKGGKAIGLTGTSEDITERKNTEGELERRIRQQDGIARFGELALRQTDPQMLLDSAAVEVRRLLGCEFCKILELLPDGQSFLLRAGSGWKDGLVGTMTVPSDQDSQSGYTLKVEHAVIVEDHLTETRFVSPPMMAEHNVRSGVSVLIAGDEGRVFGVLGAFSVRPGYFRQHDIDFLQSIANILAGAVHRQTAMQRQLLLTRELRHRVGNLLTLVLSLFNNTARRAHSVDELFEKFVARVMSLSRSHTHLSYGGWSTAGLQKVVKEVLEPFLDRIEVDGRDIQVNADSAFALSLALHELATNAAKYGSLSSPDGRLSLTWRAETHPHGPPCLIVEWTERGAVGVRPPEVDGFGSRLVSTVVTEQLGGELSVDYRPTGLMLTMRLPLQRLMREPNEIRAGMA
jgi:two-component sensor histidine kinase